MVRPNDGSDVGWREPFVYYTAEMEVAPGVWRPVPRRDDISRCGNYATDWYSDVAAIAAGESMELDHLVEPSRMLEFSRSGRVRLYAAYEYDGGKKRSSRGSSRTPAPFPKELESVGPFAIVSAPLELSVRVDTSVELSLVLRRPQVRVREHVAFGALAEASVVNRSGAVLDLGEDFPDHRFHLQVREDAGGSSYDLEGPRLLDPRQRATLRPSASERSVGSDQVGMLRLRLRYDVAHRRYRSPWVALEVVP